MTKRCQAPNLLTNFISLPALTTQPIRIDTVHHPINANSPEPSPAAAASAFPLESVRADFSRFRPDHVPLSRQSTSCACCHTTRSVHLRDLESAVCISFTSQHPL